MTTTPQESPLFAPLVLTPPEPVTPVAPAQVQGAVKLPAGLKQAVEQQLDGFIATLKTADVTSDDFRKKLDTAFSVGRKEIADATTLTGSLSKKNFSGETNTPAYLAISEMRTLLDGYNPANQGNLLEPQKLLGLIPYGNKLKSYLRRYESAEKQMNVIYEKVIEAKTAVERGVSDLGLDQQKLWSGLEKLEGVVYFISSLDERLTAHIASIRDSDPDRARALDTEVLYYVRQNLEDVLTTQALTINAYNVAGGLRKTGREVMNGCDRLATLGVAALSLGVKMARESGLQIETMKLLVGSKQSIESLIMATGEAFKAHVAETTKFASDALMGMDSLQKMFDATYSGMEILEQYRTGSLAAMSENNKMMRAQMEGYMGRLRNDRAAAAGEVGSLAVTGGIALA